MLISASSIGHPDRASGRRRGSRWIAVMVALATMETGIALARPPEIRNIDVRGLRIGATTTVTIDGVDLLPEPRCFLNENPIEALVDSKSAANRLVLQVAVPPTAASGTAMLRIATAEGFSNGIAIGIDHLPQSVISEETGALPASLHGSVSGSGVSRTHFEGQAGEEIIVEAEARRLGSKLMPVLHLYDEKRTQVAWAMPSNTLGGDARLTTKLPHAGRYLVELHDAQYAPPGSSFFRLKIGHWQFTDLVFPPAAPRGKETTLQLLGNVAGGTVVFQPQGDDSLAPVPLSGARSGPSPAVAVSELPEVIAQPSANEMPQPLPSLPIAVSGRLTKVGQRDRFLLAVKPGTKLALEIFAERHGSRIDSLLELKNKDGGVLATNDDLPVTPGIPGTTDSRLQYTVADGQDTIEVSVRDTLETANDAAIYRLVITPAEGATPNFEVALKTDVVNLPAGGRSVAEVLVRRTQFDGPIRLEIPKLPPNVAVEGTEVPANASGTLLTFINSNTTAPVSGAQLIGEIRARSSDGKIARSVLFESSPDDRTPPWLRKRIAFAATLPPDSPFDVAWSESTPASSLTLTTRLASQVRITRPAATYGPVRLTLISSQDPPRVNGQLNPTFNVRQERPIELAVDPKVKAAGDAFTALEKQHRDAVAKAAAAQGEAKTAADAAVADLLKKKEAAAAALKEAEAKAVYISEMPVIVPATLTDASCDLTVRAELLNPERNTVLQTAYAPVRRLPVVIPLTLKLASTEPVKATLDPKAGAVLKIDAKIERLGDYKGAVTVAVTGLPPGVVLPNVSVPADKSDFQLDLRVPANFVGDEISGIQLAANGPGDPLSGNQPLRAAPVSLTVKIERPLPPK